MANGGYKKQQFTSRALRPGGFGTVAPPKPGSGGGKLLGVSTAGLPRPRGGGGDTGGKISGPTAPKAATAPKLPNIKVGPKIAAMPKMPKLKI